MLHAPTIFVAVPAMVAVHSPGEPPKSPSASRWATGLVQMLNFARDALSLTIENPSLKVLGALPVVVKMDVPLVAGLDQMLAPTVPDGVAQ